MIEQNGDQIKSVHKDEKKDPIRAHCISAAGFNYCNFGAICPAVWASVCNRDKLLRETDPRKESATRSGNQSFVYCIYCLAGFFYCVTLVTVTVREALNCFKSYTTPLGGIGAS